MKDHTLDELDKVSKMLAKSDALTSAIARQDQYMDALVETKVQADLVKGNLAELVKPSPAVQTVLQHKNTLDACVKDLPLTRLETPVSQIAQLQQRKPELFEPNPALKAIAQQNRWGNLTGLQRFVTRFSEVLGTVGKIGADIVNSPLITGLGKAAVKLEQAEPAIMRFLNNLAQSPIARFLEELATVLPDREQFNHLYLKTMYDARWFPYTGDSQEVDPDFLADILDILDHTRVSNNRTKQLDKLIFSRYTKTRIEDMRKSWRKAGLPNCKVRILNEAVRAYHRKEYATTVNNLITQWEGLIQEKVNDTSFRMSRKTRENLEKLLESNGYDEIVASFCKEFIFYKCESQAEVKKDVPGRHGIAHSWFDRYPNRKIALNAILFTDFLVKLDPLSEEETQQN